MKHFPSRSHSSILLCFALILVISVFSSCKDEENTDSKELILTIASEKLIYPGGSISYSPYLAKTEGIKEWGTFPYIEGFEHEEGYEYVIKIWQERQPGVEVMDASIYRYKLLKTISKVKKDSENMPPQRIGILIASKKTKDLSAPYFVKMGATGQWTPFPEIKDFNYQEGLEYLISVDRIFHGSNASPKFSYTFRETYKVTPKNSEGLPE